MKSNLIDIDVWHERVFANEPDPSQTIHSATVMRTWQQDRLSSSLSPVEKFHQEKNFLFDSLLTITYSNNVSIETSHCVRSAAEYWEKFGTSQQSASIELLKN